MRILHVAPAYYPATFWGGPIFSTKALCDGLARQPGTELRVLTIDTAGPSLRERVRPTHNPERFPAGYDVFYTRRVAGHSIAPELIPRLWPEVKWADIVHITSSYSFSTIPALLAARLIGKPVVWSPRGGLQATEEWAEAPRRRAKMVFERVCQVVRPRRTVLHTTADVEAELSVKRLSGIETTLIPNSVELPENDPHEGRDWRPGGRLRLIFLSRLHEKKGLDTLIRVVASLPNHVTLDIYGTGEGYYVEFLNSLVSELGVGERVVFRGHVEAVAKEAAFRNADLFVLPTHTENFGIAIAEALAHGVPAITTRNAPWSGIGQNDCGAWIASGEDALRAAIEDLESRDLQAMGRRGYEWMARDFSPEAVVAKMVEVYRGLLDHDSPDPGVK